MTRLPQGSGEADAAANRWADAWPDALAFAGGLAVAWFAGWQTADLVWSLWLSSLVVGYTMIVWMIFGPVVTIGRAAATGDRSIQHSGKNLAVAGSAYLLGGLFLLGFFTFHFGLFHFVHSAFLNAFFPLVPGAKPGMPGPGLYGEVMSRYWIFLPMAFIAERKAFRLPGSELAEAEDTAVTADAIAARKARNANESGMNGLMAPYKNVIRMHLLIFFFAFAHFAKLESFLVYVVVYAAYFFPWRLLRRQSQASMSTIS